LGMARIRVGFFEQKATKENQEHKTGKRFIVNSAIYLFFWAIFFNHGLHG
jgi:hypothetical protein